MEKERFWNSLIYDEINFWDDEKAMRTQHFQIDPTDQRFEFDIEVNRFVDNRKVNKHKERRSQINSRSFLPDAPPDPESSSDTSSDDEEYDSQGNLIDPSQPGLASTSNAMPRIVHPDPSSASFQAGSQVMTRNLTSQKSQQFEKKITGILKNQKSNIVS